MVKWTDRLDMSIAIDWNINLKPNKQTKTNACCVDRDSQIMKLLCANYMQKPILALPPEPKCIKLLFTNFF